MNLIKAEAWKVQVPLLHEWTSSPEFGMHGHQADCRLILALHDDAGNIGWGENSIFEDASVALELQRLVDHGKLKNPLCQIDLALSGEVYWSGLQHPRRIPHRWKNYGTAFAILSKTWLKLPRPTYEPAPLVTCWEAFGGNG